MNQPARPPSKMREQAVGGAEGIGRGGRKILVDREVLMRRALSAMVLAAVVVVVSMAQGCIIIDRHGWHHGRCIAPGAVGQ
jgi:hypothetical protein